MAAATTDRIEKQILINAPRDRVWRALSDSTEFGTWFGVAFDGPFVAGRPLRGAIVGTEVDPDVAKAQQPHVGTPFELTVERRQSQRQFLFRRHPLALDHHV